MVHLDSSHCMDHESLFVQQRTLFWFQLGYKNSHADVSVSQFFFFFFTGYQIGMVIWLSVEDVPSNISTVLTVHHCNEEFRLFATVAMYCDTFDACIMAVLEDEMIIT
jgi:hypothetical protein